MTRIPKTLVIDEVIVKRGSRSPLWIALWDYLLAEDETGTSPLTDVVPSTPTTTGDADAMEEASSTR